MTDKQRTLIRLHGALTAARAALTSASPTVLGEIDYARRIDAIDEDLRKLARDIALECGL